jgi:nucleotide-binding universal stress UspA family protein
LKKGEGFISQFVYQDEVSSATINVQTVIKKRISAHYAITEYAEEHAHIVVMATHGRSGLSHLLLGSTAEKVARHLKLPVLTVKPDFDNAR